MKTQTQNKKKLRTRSQLWLERLARVESPNVTYMGDSFPVVMKKSKGIFVTDSDNRKYRDFTSCFGVLALGHRHPLFLNAMRKHTARLVHGMGDVHPSEAKIRLLELLAKILPLENVKSVLSLSGGEAIETALKTAMLATGREQFLAFHGGYHGLHLGALSLSDRPLFTHGFESWVKGRCTHLPYPFHEAELMQSNGLASLDEIQGALNFPSEDEVLEKLEEHLATGRFAALVLEPIQGRGGERMFSAAFASQCRFLTKKYGTLLIFDEIFTGFGRTGTLFAMEWLDVVPDLVCLGKALGGGLPLSVCAGNCMDVWGKSEGEARHTSTFLGHPLACGVARDVTLALIQKLPALQLNGQALDVALSNFLLRSAELQLGREQTIVARGRGFMRGLWFPFASPGYAAVLSEALLDKGYLVLPSGPDATTLAITPPLNTPIALYDKFFADVSSAIVSLSQ